MDRRLALAALLAIPPLTWLFHRLAESGLRPLTACLLGLAAYWMLLAPGLARGGWSLALRFPPLPVALCCILPLVPLVTAALPSLARLSPPVLATVALAALVNGTLEEAFWRGALVPRLGPRDRMRAVPPVMLFTLWHVAPAAALVRLDARGELPGGVAGVILGALLLGALAMAARLGSGTAGFGAVLHAAVNLCTFGVLAVSAS